MLLARDLLIIEDYALEEIGYKVIQDNQNKILEIDK